VCPLTSDLQINAPAIRINIAPTAKNGLHQPSQIAIDKITTLPVARISLVLGKADAEVMAQVARALAVFLDIG
jgi:mRNA interferase MazF